MSQTNHNRRSIRLPEYDYSWPGAYFITICTHQRECCLGDIRAGEMNLNDLGKCVDRCWQNLPEHYEELSLGEFVIMPNHVHGILIIGTSPVNVWVIHELPIHRHHELPLHYELPQHHELPRQVQRRKMLLSKIIGRFKMTSGKQINMIRNTSGQPVWQRNYYEHIIRNKKAYANIEKYIRNNPANWNQDSDDVDRDVRTLIGN